MNPKSWSMETPPQPEEAFFFFLEPNNKNPLTIGNKKEFFYKTIFFVLFITVFKFILIDYIPSILESIFIIILFLLLVSFLILYLHYLNNIARKGLSKLGLYLLIPVGVVFF